MIKAILFDLGGTLIEYAGSYESWPELETPGLRAAYESLRRNGVPLREPDAFQAKGLELLPIRWQQATAGKRNLTVPSLLADILDGLEVETPVDAILELARDCFQDAVCQGASPIPGAGKLLAYLKEEGYPLGLISNTMFSGSAHVADLKQFGLDRYFDSMLFSADENKWKPNVAPFNHVLAELHAQPHQSVFVGDDPSADIKGARIAGLFAVHIRSSQRFGSPDGSAPDAIIDELAQIPGILAQLNGHGSHGTLRTG